MHMTTGGETQYIPNFFSFSVGVSIELDMDLELCHSPIAEGLKLYNNIIIIIVGMGMAHQTSKFKVHYNYT